MSLSRRRFLITVLLSRLGSAFARDSRVAAGLGPSPPAPAGEDFHEAWIRETGGAMVANSDEISVTLPLVAEDGAFVAVSLRSRIPGTDRIALFVEKNPFPLIAAFDFAAAASPVVSLNIKMNESSAVVVLARAGNKYYRTNRHVRVVRGGCGDSGGPHDRNF